VINACIGTRLPGQPMRSAVPASPRGDRATETVLLSHLRFLLPASPDSNFSPPRTLEASCVYMKMITAEMAAQAGRDALREHDLRGCSCRRETAAYGRAGGRANRIGGDWIRKNSRIPHIVRATLALEILAKVLG